MKNSTTPKKDSRSMFARFGKAAAALAFGGMLCTFAVGSALAYDHRGGGHAHVAAHGGYHGGYHGGGHWGGGYYAPGPNYYVAPEPYAYSGPGPCYGPDGEYDCGGPPPSGINLFFGL
jgi:hypothetical protein